MWSHKSALLLFAAVCFAAEMDLTLINLPGSCSSKCKTSCAIVRNPDNSKIPSHKSCVIYEDPYDFNLNIGCLSISAHIKVLAASIPYFEDSSTSIQSKTQNLLKQELDPKAVKSLFSYAYTRKVKIDNDNVKDVLKAATFLNIKNVISICSDFLIGRINNRNVIEIINNEESNRNVTPLRLAAEKHILQHFADVSLENEFVDLDSSVFLRLMRSNLIRNASEESIFDAAFKWITHNQTNRAALSYQVMENVRFPLIDVTYLMQNVTPNILSIHNDLVNQLLYEAMDYKSSPTSRLKVQGCRTMPRNGTNRFINVNLRSKKNPVQMYEPEVRRLEYAANTPDKDLYITLLHNCNLFAIGGTNYNAVDVYHPTTNSWRPIESMIEERSEAAAAVWSGIIFVSGGDQNGVVISSAESYSIYSRCWTKIPPMAQKRSAHRLVTIGDTIYAIGGWDSNSMKSVEIYDILRQEWTEGPSMLNERYYFGAALLNGKLYVCGGYGSGSQLAEVFDPKKQSWTALAGMKKSKSFVSLVSYKYKLWAFSKDSLESEVYDPETDSWTDLPDVFTLDGDLRETILMNF